MNKDLDQLTFEFEEIDLPDENTSVSEIDFDFFESTGSENKIFNDKSPLTDLTFDNPTATDTLSALQNNLNVDQQMIDSLIDNNNFIENSEVDLEPEVFAVDDVMKNLFDNTEEMKETLSKIASEADTASLADSFLENITSVIDDPVVRQNLAATMNDIFNSDEDEMIELMSDDKVETVNISKEIFYSEPVKEYGKVKILTIGVGGAGTNAVSRLKRNNVHSTLIAIDTNEQELDRSNADRKILIGDGLGVGRNTSKANEYFSEKEEEIAALLADTDMVFIAGGLGKTTGSTLIPKIAKIAKDLGVLTVSIITLPFENEGDRVRETAENALEALTGATDTYLIIENEKLSNNENMNIFDMYKTSDIALVDSIQGVMDVIYRTGYMNTDFADIKTTLKDSGPCLIGVGIGVGEKENPSKKIEDGIINAINSDLISDISLNNCEKAILNLTFKPKSCTLFEAELATKILNEKIKVEMNYIFGIVYDDSLAEDEMKATVIATGNKNYDPVAEYKSRSYHLKNSETVAIDDTDFTEATKNIDPKRPSFFN